MTGEKKIVGLWREPGSGKADEAAEAALSLEQSPDAAMACISADGDIELTQPPPTPGWLDRPATDDASADWDMEPDSSARGHAWRDRLIAPLLIVTGLAWTGFCVWDATGAFGTAIDRATLPPLIATISMPLTLLGVLWLSILRSGSAEQNRFVKLAAGLRSENDALNQSMQALGQHLADARRQLAEQATAVQQLGLDAATRLHDSSSKLSSSAQVIADANDKLAASGDIAFQRMEGLLAGLPRIDAVAQRLADNFREAGSIAHQHGSSLEAKLATVAEQASKAGESSLAAAAALQNALAEMEVRARNADDALRQTSDTITAVSIAATDAAAKRNQTISNDLAVTIADLEARMDETHQIFGRQLSTAADTLDKRLDAAKLASADIGSKLDGHGQASADLVTAFAGHAAELEKRLAALGRATTAQTQGLSRALSDVQAQLVGFGEHAVSGNREAQQLIGHAESLLLALDSVSRELDESIPRALDRIGEHSTATQTIVRALRPALNDSELVAQSTLSHIEELGAKIDGSRQGMASLSEEQRGYGDTLRAALADADGTLHGLNVRAASFAEDGAAQMIAALEQVKQTADSAAEQARATIEAVVADASEDMRRRASEAIDASLKTEIGVQLAAIEGASERAVTAATSAADRLMRQLITIMDTSASIEKRVVEADQAIAASSRDTLAKQVGLLTESLKSTAIDLTKILSSEVSDHAWDAYLKGDRGVFSRRAVKLVENHEVKEILRLYNSDDAFHDAVNHYIHDFEAMLRSLMGARDGSAISVTLLSSDLGKLYVALAQSIDRLRN